MTESQPDLTIGDRSPNFVLPGLDGEFYSFHERVSGKRTVLFLSSQADDKTMSIVAAFTAARDALETHQVDVMVVIAATLEELSAHAAMKDSPHQIFADIQGKIFLGFRDLLARSGAAPICLILDENQRVLGSVDAGSGGPVCAARVMEFLDTHPLPDERHTLGNSAPVLLVPNVLEPELCKTLVHRWETMGHEEGKVQSVFSGEDHQRVAFEGKRRLDHEINDGALTQQLGIRVLRRVAPELEKAYRFEGFRLDPFLIGCYQAERQDFFRPHRDNLAPTNANRMFALSINLNADEYDGGNLKFPEYGPHQYRPPTGGALVFSCSLIHEAMPVTKGRRFVLLSFLRDVRPPGAARTPRPPGGA